MKCPRCNKEHRKGSNALKACFREARIEHVIHCFPQKGDTPCICSLQSMLKYIKEKEE
jgi:hypothetical protein